MNKEIEHEDDQRSRPVFRGVPELIRGRAISQYVEQYTEFQFDRAEMIGVMMGIKTLLVVEHSPQMRRLIRTLVASQVEQIVECAEGREALAAYANCRPDWVLMDIATSASDGIAATRRIKELFPDANITILTDYDDPAIRESAFRAGASGYVVKEDLRALQTFLGEHVSNDASGS